MGRGRWKMFLNRGDKEGRSISGLGVKKWLEKVLSVKIMLVYMVFWEF